MKEVKKVPGGVVYEGDYNPAAFLPVFRVLISGPAGVGKTTWVYQLLKERKHLIRGDIDRVWYCSPGLEHGTSEDHELGDRLQELFPGQLELVQGLPDFEMVGNYEGHKVVILDDLSQDVVNNPEIYKLYSYLSTHRQISTVYLSQSIFTPSKYGSAILRNSDYHVIFLDRTNVLTLSTLSKNSHPGGGNLYFQYLNWLDERHLVYSPYIVVDNSTKAKTSKEFRVRSRIFALKDGTYAPIFFSTS